MCKMLANAVRFAKMASMALKHFLNTLTSEQREALAVQAQTSVGYLDQLKGGHRKPGPALARRLVAASRGGLTLADVRPDLWGEAA